MSDLTPEILARMAALSAEHSIAFHFARLAGDPPQFDCIIRDSVNQVVSRGEGDGRTEAAEAAIESIDFSLIGRSQADMARELAALKAEFAKTARSKRDPTVPTSTSLS